MDKEPKELRWPAIRDLFAQIIKKSDWQHADIVATPQEMSEHFEKAFPDVYVSMSDLRLALHDLNIPYERNEHNNKYYYLAKWI